MESIYEGIMFSKKSMIVHHVHHQKDIVFPCFSRQFVSQRNINPVMVAFPRSWKNLSPAGRARAECPWWSNCLNCLSFATAISLFMYLYYIYICISYAIYLMLYILCYISYAIYIYCLFGYIRYHANKCRYHRDS